MSGHAEHLVERVVAYLQTQGVIVMHRGADGWAFDVVNENGDVKMVWVNDLISEFIGNPE